MANTISAAIASIDATATVTTGPTGPFIFTGLPSELRQKVYQEVLPSDETFRINEVDGQPTTLITLPLASVCKIIRTEVLHLFYSKNSFALTYAPTDFATTRTRVLTHRIAKLELHYTSNVGLLDTLITRISPYPNVLGSFPHLKTLILVNHTTRPSVILLMAAFITLFRHSDSKVKPRVHATFTSPPECCCTTYEAAHRPPPAQYELWKTALKMLRVARHVATHAKMGMARIVCPRAEEVMFKGSLPVKDWEDAEDGFRRLGIRMHTRVWADLGMEGREEMVDGQMRHWEVPVLRRTIEAEWNVGIERGESAGPRPLPEA